MNRPIPVKTLKIITFLFGTFLLLEGCGSLVNQGASIDPKSLQVSVSLNPVISSDPSSTNSLVRPGEEGGHRTTAMYSLSASVSTYVVSVSGTASHAVSVIASLDGNDVSLTLDAQGNFNAVIAVDAVPHSISFTPMSNDGLLGDVVNFDIAKMPLIP